MRLLEIFKEITNIPRCSGNHKYFIEFMKNFAKSNNYLCQIDSENNILCFKDNKNITLSLQSHYDIVCLEENKIPEIYEEDGYLKAKDSTLGADNGIGCAYMLYLMEENSNCEFLFTCDEEIGLIGANNITHKLKSKYMLNLDSEALGEIAIGCAGGVDIYGINKKSSYVENIDNKTLYEITIDNLEGGHSGIDIDKNIPNAIKLLAKTIKESNADILDINGGERTNSIPKYTKAIIAVDKDIVPLASHKNMKIEKVDAETQHYKKLDDNIKDFLYIFSNGVRGYDSELGVVLSSINLSTITNTLDGIKIELSARSMCNDELEILKKESVALFEHFDFEVTINGKLPAWKPVKNDFITIVHKVYEKHIKGSTINAIHAGLECAVFKSKYPDIQICSIGPNIYFPHSTREECDISSVFKVYNVIKDIIDEVEKC
ncbi:MAG: M20/M25/M40 family metallo-hydrolase [Campylobacterota bacterium]|nr:M20/M25/M40 family metallo-hydrolase [Campylobacterota bacterium]